MIGRWFRPYSLRLAVVCLPLSYLVFVAFFWGWTYIAAADTATTASRGKGLIVCKRHLAAVLVLGLCLAGVGSATEKGEKAPELPRCRM